MNILVLNCGSSSLKFQLIDTDLVRMKADADETLVRGLIERIGSASVVSFSARERGGQKPFGKVFRDAQPFRNHQQAIDFLIKWLVGEGSKYSGITSVSQIQGVGHRVVHGGEFFSESQLIDSRAVEGIEDCIELAPLHNPSNLMGIRAIQATFGTAVPQVAVFDTAFHYHMPQSSYIYAIPYQFYRRHKVRRYGFHGTSHRYIAYRYRRMHGIKKNQVKIVTLHLGNGCSACAIENGKSVDTSMGLTPLEGLVMGTRSGDLDPAVMEFLSAKEGLSITEMDALLNKQSGLLGISGLTNDMRELLEECAEHNDRRALLAIDVFVRRVRKYIGSYIANMDGADALVFSGGIGENSPQIRREICKTLGYLGVELDPEVNEETHGGGEQLISVEGSRLPVYVIPTDEELLIARDTVRCMSDAGKCD